MYFDLNVPVPTPALGRPPNANQGQSKKGKGKANNSNQNNAQQDQIPTSFSPGQITALESRIDLLVHCPYCLPEHIINPTKALTEL
jgi:ribonuclease P/MRP protein subunit RPP1